MQEQTRAEVEHFGLSSPSLICDQIYKLPDGCFTVNVCINECCPVDGRSAGDPFDGNDLSLLSAKCQSCSSFGRRTDGRHRVYLLIVLAHTGIFFTRCNDLFNVHKLNADEFAGSQGVQWPLLNWNVRFSFDPIRD